MGMVTRARGTLDVQFTRNCSNNQRHHHYRQHGIVLIVTIHMQVSVYYP